MSLRVVHLVFVLLVIVAADMFGAWGVYTHGQTGERAALVAGIIGFAVGFALIGYGYWLVRKFDRSRIE